MTQISESVDLETLASIARGTAYVSALAVRGENTLVRLAFPHGRTIDVVVPVLPEPDPTFGSIRPLAVQVTGTGAGLTCTVLASSAGGPTRRDISLAHAMALTDSGVHTVFKTA